MQELLPRRNSLDQREQVETTLHSLNQQHTCVHKVQIHVHLLQSVGIARKALDLESRKKQRDIVVDILSVHEKQKDIAERVGKYVHRWFRCPPKK